MTPVLPCRRRWPLPACTALLAPLLLAGCASFSNDGGFDAVSQLTRAHIGQPATPQRTAADRASADARVAELLAEPLSPDSAVAIALLNHRGLQARYAALGIAEADLVRAGRLANPGLGFGRSHGGGAVEIDRAVMFDLLGLLTLPLARALQAQQFAQAQLQAAADTVALATEVRLAFFDAVAAQQLAGYFVQVDEAAQASAELARRMAKAGNFSALAQLREQAFEADATAQLARARHQALATRERLLRLLALQDVQAGRLRLPERLPDLPAAPATVEDAEQRALATRLDLRQARLAADAATRALDLTRHTRLVNQLHAGVVTTSGTGEPRRNGVELEVELPLFDAGSSRLARAEAVQRQAQALHEQWTLDARSEVREAHAAYLAAHALAGHYRDTVVPLRKRISDEMLLRYNGMLSSVFELLADAREQIGAVTQSVEALRDHWAAQTRLQAALAGAGTVAGPALAPASRGAATAAAGH